ncbi:MAG: PQQ-binding-like beta-propeller repeat protein [Bacteroidales bacterium]|nr:PQQ-binding-like beta-propeller repeat protein [Bacteroidales bacterium]
MRLKNVAAVSAALLFIVMALSAKADEHKFTFAYLSDVHIALGSQSVEDARVCIDDINSNPDIEFSIFAGDITEFGTDEEIALAKSIFDKLEKPYYIVAGNHDAKWSESGCNSFVKEFGYEEFEFDYGGIKFIGTNSGPNMRMAPALLPRESMVWLDSLSKTVDQAQQVFFVNHYPMDSSMLNYGQVLDILKRMNTQLIMNGHWHQDRAMVYEGIPGMIGRSTMRTGKEGPGYTLVIVDGSTVTFSERIAAHKKDGAAVEGKTGTPWHTLRMSRGVAFDASVVYERADYSVNDRYPNVKALWKRQDNSDIGSGAVYVADNGGMVVYANTAGTVYALDAKNGNTLWSYKTDGKIFSTPAVGKGIVVVGSSDNNIYALDLKSGQKRWSYKCGKSVLGSPAIMSGIVYIGASDNCFRALNLRTGALVWEYSGIKGFIEAKPFADKEQVVIGDWANTLYSFNPSNGKLQWNWSNNGSRMLSPAAVFPVKANGKIIIATPERVTYAIDAKSGRQLWRARGGRESVGLSPDKNTYYVKTMLDTVFAYSTKNTIPFQQADGKEGLLPETVWAANAGFGYEIAPTPTTSIAGEGKDGKGLLFVATDKGNIIAMNCSDGSIAWEHRFSAALINYIQPLGGRRILVSAMDGFVGILEY